MNSTTPPAPAGLIEQMNAARTAKPPLASTGGNTKAWYGEAPCGEPLDVTGLAGISSYEPTELVVTLRAGTRLAERIRISSGPCRARDGSSPPWDGGRCMPGWLGTGNWRLGRLLAAT